MASSEVDQKFLGRLARAVEHENPFLSQMLFRILGLSLNLADKLRAAKRQRPRDPSRVSQFIDLANRIIWLAREGLGILEQYVLPWVGPTHNRELIVLACKLRASFLHIYVLFYNQPAVSPMNISGPDALMALAIRAAKGKAAASAVDDEDEHGCYYDDFSDYSLLQQQPQQQSSHAPLDDGSAGTDSIALGIQPRLIQAADYLPTAAEYFKTAARIADEMLWGSHSLRLSVKTEYAAFLYECAHEPEASRKLAQDAIAEVYDAQEGMTDDMFEDACELVTILGKMKRRGLAPSRQGSTGAQTSIAPAALGTTTSSSRASNRTLSVPPGMENAI